MNQTTLRINAAIRRNLARIPMRGDFSTSYLVRDERPCTVKNIILGEYSEATLVKSYDFRNGNIVGHFFNGRNVYSLAEVIVEPVQGLIYDLRGSLIADSTVWPLFQLFNSFPWRPTKVHKTVDVGECILIPSNELLSRLQYGWFIRSSPRQVLESDTIIGNYLLLSVGPEDKQGILEPLEVKPNWVGFWKTPLYSGLWGLNPIGLGNNLNRVPYTGR